jgi:hypothetical protein
MKRKIAVLAASAALVLSGCGAGYSAVSKVERKNVDGVDCVLYTGAGGSVAVSCDWERATP